jgi:hypothetical protein
LAAASCSEDVDLNRALLGDAAGSGRMVDGSILATDTDRFVSGSQRRARRSRVQIR